MTDPNPSCTYTSARGPLGIVYLAVRAARVVRIHIGGTESAFAASLEGAWGGAVRRDDRGLASFRRPLAEYLAGRRTTLDLPADLEGLPPFQARVLSLLRQVPYGSVVSYGELARRAGRPGGARAVGQAMGANPLPILYPCHRVVASNGTLGGFTGGLHLKRALLELEHVRLPLETTRPRAGRGKRVKASGAPPHAPA